MKILVADIGGTHSRFADAEISGPECVALSEPLVFKTNAHGIDSFAVLMGHYRKLAGRSPADLESFDAAVLAVAGAVDGERAILPNIPWGIDLGTCRPVPNTWMLNDFRAQAYALLDPAARERLQLVREGHRAGCTASALIGAGTGLGHAAVLVSGRERVVVGSEAGHIAFAFSGARERQIESFMRSRTRRAWLSEDDVVSGSGAVLIHECLTGVSASAAEALADKDETRKTRELFSRFYARACRNYCLAMHPVRELIVSGGIAMHNPHLLLSPAFETEFNDARAYRPMFERIPLYLNRDHNLGLPGAAIFAWFQLNAEPRRQRRPSPASG